MARYASPDKVRGVLARRWSTDPDGPGEEFSGTAADLPDERLIERVETASAEVDAALATEGYRIVGDPVDGVTPAPRLVQDVTVAIAAYLAELSYLEGAPIEDSDPVVKLYEWAQMMLAFWGKGERLPPGLAEPAPGHTGDLLVGSPVNPCVGPLFGAEILDPRPAVWSDVYDPDYWRHG